MTHVQHSRAMTLVQRDTHVPTYATRMCHDSCVTWHVWAMTHSCVPWLMRTDSAKLKMHYRISHSTHESTFTLTHSHSHIHTHTFALTHSHSHIHTHIFTLTHLHSHIHTHTFTLTHSHSHVHTHTFTLMTLTSVNVDECECLFFLIFFSHSWRSRVWMLMSVSVHFFLFHTRDTHECECWWVWMLISFLFFSHSWHSRV